MAIRPARWDDLEQVGTLLAAQRRQATGVAGIEAELVRAEWELPGFQMGEDNLVVEHAGKVVGYAAVSSARGLSLAAHDDATADELLSRIVERARLCGVNSLRIALSSDSDPRGAVIRRHGFELESEAIVMRCRLTSDLPEPDWPAGVRARTFRAGDAVAVHRLLDDAYGGWDPRYAPMTDDDWVRWMTGDIEFDPTVWWLAERDGALVGCALHWNSGWLKDIAVRETERRQGLGAALVSQGLVEFGRRGMGRVGLKVDAANPTGAVALYERLGFVEERREGTWALSL